MPVGCIWNVVLDRFSQATTHTISLYLVLARLTLHSAATNIRGTDYQHSGVHHLGNPGIPGFQTLYHDPDLGIFISSPWQRYTQPVCSLVYFNSNSLPKIAAVSHHYKAVFSPEWETTCKTHFRWSARTTLGSSQIQSSRSDICRSHCTFFSGLPEHFLPHASSLLLTDWICSATIRIEQRSMPFMELTTKSQFSQNTCK